MGGGKGERKGGADAGIHAAGVWGAQGKRGGAARREGTTAAQRPHLAGKGVWVAGSGGGQQH